MARYIHDAWKQRWTILAPNRTSRPSSAVSHGGPDGSADPIVDQGCPFCPGHEAMTPPEVLRIGSGLKNKPGWDVRVVHNLFPIADIHEVIIHSPSHTDDIERLSLEHVIKILCAYQRRIRKHKGKGTIVVFGNHGRQGGASMNHPHSQLVVVPPHIPVEIHAKEPVANIVQENETFVIYCPDYSEWPFEMFVAPKISRSTFGQLNEDELLCLATSLQLGIRRLNAVYHNPASTYAHAGGSFGYNFYFYEKPDWYVRLIPRFIHRAGFELATAILVNAVDPKEAAARLRMSL